VPKAVLHAVSRGRKIGLFATTRGASPTTERGLRIPRSACGSSWSSSTLHKTLKKGVSSGQGAEQILTEK
jgi:hypothetical protein